MSSESAVPSSPSSTITSNNGGEAGLVEEEEGGEEELVPSSALLALGNGLRQDRAPQVYAQEAGECFQAALQLLIGAGNDRLEPHCEWFVSEFLVEVVPELLNRVLKDTLPRRWPTFFPDVLGWCSCLTKIGCLLLAQLRGCPAPDEKALQVTKYPYRTVLLGRSEFSKAYRSASRGRSGEPIEDNVDDQDGEGVAWRLMLAEKFQEDGGIESICRILEMTLLYPEFEFIEGLIVLGARVAYAGQKVLDCSELSQVVTQVLDGLKNGPPQAWRCTLIQMTNIVPSVLGIITVAESQAVAEDVVGRYQQHVVADHLKTGTFNTRVAAVNWLDGIIYRAFRTENDSAIQRIRGWLQDESIVELMFSEHLEKTHYAEQVLSALRMMAQAGLLEDGHVKSLYLIIEPEGTFEGLKENVHTVMLHLLDFLNPEQVQSALEIASSIVGDVASATRMSNLVYRVVSTDREVQHHEQTMEILWLMMVQYSHVRVESDPLWRSFIRCMKIYVECDCSDLRAKYLKLAVRELTEGKVTVMMLQVLMSLYNHDKDMDIGILDVVVLSLQRYHDQTPKEIRKNAELMANSPNSEISVLHYDFNVTAECLKQVQKIAVWGKVAFSGMGLRLEVAEQIWDLLVLDPVCLTERIHALEWFIELVSPLPDEPCTLMTDRDAKALLHGRICELDPFKLDFTAFRCFRTFFAKVSPSQGLSATPEVDYLWNVLLNNQNADVAAGAQEMVGNLYSQTFESQHEFIRGTMSHLRDGVCELAGKECNGDSCVNAIDHLSATHHSQEMKEECGMRIMRCLEALDFMMKQAHSLSSRGELSQLEDLIYVLLYLADCQHPVHDVACSLLDNLPLRHGLVMAIREALPNRDVLSLNTAINTTFHRGPASGKLLPEKARYVILALADALYSNTEVECELGGLIQLCLSFVLELLEKVDITESKQAGQVAKCGRRLHMEGVRLVSHLCSDLVCDPHSHQHNTDAAQPLQANHIADGNLGSTQGSLLHSSLASSNPQESHVQPGSPMVDDDAQNCPPCRNTVRAEVLDSKPEAIIGGKMDSMDLEPTRDSSTAMGSGMEGVQEEPSSQKGSAMDISTGRMSGQCSSVDAAVMPDQRASNSEEDFGISGKNPRQNGHHLPTIMEVPSGGVGHEENEQEQEAELCSAKDQVNPCFERDSENNLSIDNPISACSSSEVGPAAASPHSDRANADPPRDSACQIHIEENQTDPDLSTSKPDRVTRDDQDGSENAPGAVSSPESPSLTCLLNRVLKYYVHVICEAGRGWDCKKAGHRTDVDLLRETMEQLGQLAAQWTFIMDAMMVCDGVVDMLVTYLLSPVDCIRKQMVSLVRRINKCGPAVGPWIFQFLKKHRAMADKHPECCQEFYTLLQEFCRGFENCTRLVEVEDAGALLQEVLQDIRAHPYEESAKGTRLGCQLRLLAVLIKVLEPDCVGNMSIKCEGPAREGDLVRFLMKDILFPETCLLGSMNMETPSIDELMAVLKTKSTPLLTREAAFDLLLTLMKISSVSHKMAMDLVWELHFHPMAPGYVDNQWQPAKNPDGYVGLQNAGATCYMNAVLQQLFMNPTIRSGVLWADVAATERDRGIFYPFQRLFGHLQCSDRSAFFPSDFIERYTHSDGQEVDIRQHHDALEFFQRTQELVDDYMSRKGLKSVIKNEIGGLFSQQIICRDNRKVYFSETQQPYTEVTLEMLGKTNLQESLEAYVSGERLEGDNAYFCQEWSKKVPALKRTCIKTLPHTLVIHLKRFELDYETMETFKIQERFEFPLTLDMFPFTSAFLLQKEGLSKEDGVSCDPTNTIQPSQCQYQLMGVVVHKGEIDGGHYYSFVKERPCVEKDDQDCRWWRFDDSSVEEWDVNRLDEDCFGGPKIEEDSVDRQRDSTDDLVKSRANNAYLLIYEQLENEDTSCEGELQLDSNGIKAYPQNPKDQLPRCIFKEVLVENVRLLSTTRVTDLAFMHFMQNLLQTMPCSSAHRKMRRLTPPESKSESESSSGSEGGGQGSDVSIDRDTSQKKPQESKEVAGRRDDEQPLAHDIADLVFEYMLRIMFTPCVFLEADYASWEHILKVTQDGSIALQVALEKLAFYSERVARCLIPQACEPSSDFVYHFVMAVIKEARRISPEPENVKASPIYLLGLGILEACGSRTIIPLDLLRVFEVVRCCAQMVLKWGHRSLILKQLTAMQRTAAKLSALVWAGRSSSPPKKLESLYSLLLRTVQSVTNDIDDECCRIPKVVRDCFCEDCDPEFVKGFVHPLLLVQAEFVEFLQIYMWDSDSLSIWVLDGLLDLLVEENDRMGWLDQFDKITNSILKILSTGDCFHGHSQRAHYLIQPKRDRDSQGLYQTIFQATSNVFRWKLVYLLMRISKQEGNDDVNRLFRNASNDRLVNWVAKDGALSQLESYINRKEVYEWTRQITGAS